MAATAAVTAGCTADASSSGPTGTPSAATPTRTATPYVETVRDEDLARPAPPVAPGGLTETFDDPAALSDWRVSYGEPRAGGPASVTVEDGALRIVSAQTAWLGNAHGTGVARTIDGDAAVVVDLSVRGTQTESPTVDWSLAGVMLRAPGMQERENWLHWTAGYVDGHTLERKGTVNGVSQLSLIPIDPGPVRLALIRADDLVIMLHRQGSDPWRRGAVYSWPTSPSGAEILLTAQSGFEDDRADMVAVFDSVTITDAPPAEVVEAVLDGDTSGLAL